MAINENELEPTDKTMFSPAVYDKLKYIALIVLPALATFYITLGNVWDWPNLEEVALTITAIDTFLGVLLGISTSRYNSSNARFDGAVVVTENLETGAKMYTLELKGDPADIDDKDSVSFKVIS